MVVAVAITAATVAGLQVYTNSFLYPKILAAQGIHQSFEKLISADLQTLGKISAFKKLDYKNNASGFLRNYLPLENGTISRSQEKQNRIVTRLFKNNPNWVYDKIHFNDLTGDPEFTQLEPKWLEQLKPYDHWNGAEENSKNFALLRDWASVYAIKKLQIKDLNAGFKIFRKTAELINSAGYLNSQLIGVAMLKSEHKLMNDFQARDWQLVPLKSIEAYRRLSWAWISLSHQIFFGELNPEFNPYLTPQFGVCASALENSSTLIKSKEFLEPHVSFEKSFGENFARAEKFRATLQKICHVVELNKISEASTKVVQSINRLPFVRKLIGMNLILDINVDYLAPYRELTAVKLKN